MKKDLFVVNRRLGLPTKKDMGLLYGSFYNKKIVFLT